jgi:hypothetical protein
VTLATLDECLGRMTPEEFVEESLREAGEAARLRLLHGARGVEGMGYKAVLESFLAKLGRPTCPLGEATRGALPRREIRLGRVPGRPYDVCLS